MPLISPGTKADRVASVIKKELRQIMRDKRSLGILFFIPLFMLVMFGYALNFDVKHTSLAVVDLDISRESRHLISEFSHSEYFTVKHLPSAVNELDHLLGSEKVRAAIVIPRGYAADLAKGRSPTVQVILDGVNANAANTIQGYLNAFFLNYSYQLTIKVARRLGVAAINQPIDYRPRIWFNPELKSAKFLIPGLIGFILMVVGVISTSLSIVKEKERGTMEQLLVSPIKPLELIMGKTIPYIAISLLSTAIILVVGYVLFDVHVMGSLLLLFLTTFIFLLGALGMGLLISSISETQQLAFLVAVISTILPSFLLSGFVFSIRNMPEAIQLITYAVPTRYYLVALRGIILKGAGFGAIWDQLLFLMGFATVMLLVSAIRIKRSGL
ncbi:MAG: ABC transporter permease [Candidatus Edwardsbacteria bacterium]|nr:ABC transporter permease [Candidatus Edwardsbacteria bacterium]